MKPTDALNTWPTQSAAMTLTVIDMTTEKQIARKSMMSRASRCIPKDASLSAVSESFMALLQCSLCGKRRWRGDVSCPLFNNRCRDLVGRYRDEFLEGWKRGILHFKRLHHRQTFHIFVDDLDDFGIELTVVNLREFLGLPQADGYHFRLVGRNQDQFIEETLLPAEQGKNFLFKHFRKLWCPILVDLHRNLSAKHKSLLRGVTGCLAGYGSSRVLPCARSVPNSAGVGYDLRHGTL